MLICKNKQDCVIEDVKLISLLAILDNAFLSSLSTIVIAAIIIIIIIINHVS